jgi:hypothetical protein
MPHIYIISSRRFLFKISVFILIALSFVTPPSIFAHMDFMSRDIRLFLGVMCICLFFVQVKKLRISKAYWLVMSFIIFLFFIEIFLAMSKLSNILSYYAIIFITLLLHLVLNNCSDNRYIYVDIWVKIGYFLSCSLVVLFLLHQFTLIDTDYFNLKGLMSYSARNYEYSVFGVSQAKDFGWISVARASGYFPESQYAGFYFMINILISRVQYIRDQYPKWGGVNIWAGLLTFSSAFYIVITVYFLINYVNKIKLYNRLFLLTIIIIIAGVGADQLNSVLDTLLNYTSLSDRVSRIENSFGILSNISSIANLFFGHGVEYTGGHDKGLSIGFFHVLVERGLAGLFTVLFLSFFFLKNNKNNYFVFVLYLFVFTWYVNYIYWAGALALLSAIRIDTQKKNNLNKKDAL